MADQRSVGFWDRVEPGHSTALVGGGGRVPAAPRGCWVVRARCDGPHRPLGPVIDAREAVSELLGRPALDAAAGRLRRGIRRHLLGDDPAPERDAELLADLDRLAEAGATLTALVFESVDLADDATLSLLARLVRQPLRPALVLGFRAEPARGPVRQLLELVAQIEGESRVIRSPAAAGDEAGAGGLEPARLAPPVRQALRAASVIGDGFESALVARLLGTSEREVLLRLQEARDEGVGIDDLGDGRFRLDAADAEALRQSLLPSLAAAWHRELAGLLSGEEDVASQQKPADAAPQQTPARAASQQSPAPAAEDDAPPPILSTPDLPLEEERRAPALRAPLEVIAPTEVIYQAPSAGERPAEDPFAALAPAGAPQEPAAAVAERRPPPAPPEPADPFAGLAPAGAEPAPPAPEPARARRHRPEPPAEAADPFAALSPGAEAAGPPEARAAAEPEAEPEAAPPAPPASPSPRASERRRAPSIEALRGRVRGPDRPRRSSAVPGRAAQHLAAAGDAEAAIPRFLAAARAATAEGAYGTAEAYVERALALISMLPDTGARRELRARAHAELARVHWEGSGPQGFTLAVAREEAETALRLVEELPEAASRPEIRGLVAAICYDLGDPSSLERALEQLTLASRELLEAGEARAAARLLNDQAAVWVRIGDPLRAVALLQDSRRVFAAVAEPRREDRLELAETEHLLARLPLHVATRPGREDEAVEMGVAHAEQAASIYEALGERRELARVWETLGRLERRRGALQRAWRHLTRAFEVQRGLGDAVGLARSAAALAEVLAKAGQHAEAIRYLGESIQLNATKGSPVGLAANREGVALIEGSLTPELRERHHPALAALDAALAEALARVGGAEAVRS